MSLTVDQIAEEVKALPREAKALLAERLIELLDPTDNGPIHAAWADEALRRRDEIRSGQVKTISGEEGLARVRLAVGL